MRLERNNLSIVNPEFQLSKQIISTSHKEKFCCMPMSSDPNEHEEGHNVAKKIDKERRAAINEFEIFRDSGTRAWHVVGAGLQRFVQMTNWRYMDSDKRFQHVLEACGVNKSLKNMGVKEGDTVIVGEMELVWHDSANGSSRPTDSNKTSTDSVRWPQWK